MPAIWRERGARPRRRLPRARSAAGWRAWARNGWPPASCMACSIPTTSTSPARASTTARGASCPRYDPDFTAAYFDETGLYAFGRQPDALLWNLTRLAECLLPLAPQPELEQALRAFEPALHAGFAAALLRRLGLKSEGPERDGGLAASFWSFLNETKAPFEQTFFDWRGGLPARSARRGARPPLSTPRRPLRRCRLRLKDFSQARMPISTTAISRTQRPARC